MGERPNLFTYATSELSQDAFLCWLAKWAEKGAASQDVRLNEIAQEFIRELLKKPACEAPQPDFERIEVERQYKRIDVVILVDDRWVIAIEDKVETEEHSEQLERYLEIIKRDFPSRTPVPVYLKTHDQGSYAGVSSAGWKTYLRPKLLSLLERGLSSGIQDAIFVDFARHLRDIEEEVMSYKWLPLDEWTPGSWKGFYLAVQEKFPDSIWNLVPNPREHFLACYWSPVKGEAHYLQLKEEKLQIRMKVQDPEDRESSKVAQSRFQEALWADETWPEKLGLERRGKYRRGTTCLCAEGKEDYRQANSERLLDLDATLQILRDANDLLKRASSRPQD